MEVAPFPPARPCNKSRHGAIGNNGAMSALKDQLRAELTTSMKSRDALRTSTIRMLLAEINKAEVAGTSARDLTDNDVITVLATESKRRREAAQAFDEGNRPELAEKERAEAQIISEFLPEQLSAEELSELVTAAIHQTGASTMKEMGKVMGVVTPQTKGRADGAAVAAEVRRQLGSAQ